MEDKDTQWNNSNLEVRFPALKEKTFPLSFLGLLPSLEAVSRSEAGLEPVDALPHECCTWLRNGLELGAKAGFKMGGFANTGRLQRSAKAGLQAMCKQAFKGLSHVCTIPGAETGLPRLLQGSHCAGESCWRARSCPWHCILLMSQQAACSKGKACSYLSAGGLYTYPQSGLLERQACWEVQNWVKTLPDWLDDEICF